MLSERLGVGFFFDHRRESQNNHSTLASRVDCDVPETTGFSYLSSPFTSSFSFSFLCICACLLGQRNEN